MTTDDDGMAALRRAAQLERAAVSKPVREYRQPAFDRHDAELLRTYLLHHEGNADQEATA